MKFWYDNALSLFAKSWVHVSLGILGLVLALLSAFNGWFEVSCILVTFADGYIVLLLILAAQKKPLYIPNKLPALFLVPCVFVILVLAFAAIFVETGSIQKKTLEIVHARPVADAGDGAIAGASGAASVKVSTTDLNDPWEAIYFSLVTMTTYGSEFAPSDGDAYFAIGAELASGLLLLLVAFPVLASRLALFDQTTSAVEDDVSKKTIVIQKQEGENWKIKSTTPVEGTADEDQMQVVFEDDRVKLEPPPPD